MGKEEPGAFRVKVKVKEANGQKGKARKPQRAEPKAPKAPQHRSLMEALKQVAPPKAQGQASPLGPLPEAAERAKAAAFHPLVRPQGDPGSAAHAGPALKAPGFMVSPFDVEEAEVEIAYLDAQAPDRHR